jgi:hypothetical protein
VLAMPPSKSPFTIVAAFAVAIDAEITSAESIDLMVFDFIANQPPKFISY